MSKKFYVVELGSSDPYRPDFLWVEGDVVKWYPAEEKDRRGHVIRDMRETLKIVTHFKTKKAADEKIQSLFGSLFQYRISAHEGE